MARLAPLLLITALLALAAPGTVGAKGHKAGRNAPPSDARGGDREDRREACEERVRPKRKGRDRVKPTASKPTKGQRKGARHDDDDTEDCDPGSGGGGAGGGDRAFGEGTTSGVNFRFDASSGPNGESPNPAGTETAFVQFRDSSGQVFAGPVRCLTVLGNQAVIGFDNQEPETPDIDVILFVEDNAATGSADRFDAEATVSPDNCPAPRTPLEEVTSGDITVQDNTAGGGGGGGGGGDDDGEDGDDEDDEHGHEDEEEDEDGESDDDESHDDQSDDNQSDDDESDDD